MHRGGPLAEGHTMQQAELQKMFLAFREECIWLRCCYDTFSMLYESEPQTKAVLQASAALFFGDLNRIIKEYFWLQICKITDPEETVGHKNLTFVAMNAALRDTHLMTAEIAHFSTGLSHYRELVLAARNRLISHLDQRTVLEGLHIGDHSADDVTIFFEDLHDYVDAVGNAVGVGPLDFRLTSGPGDVLTLIKTLERGLSVTP
jgi:hypothetical protein